MERNSTADCFVDSCARVQHIPIFPPLEVSVKHLLSLSVVSVLLTLASCTSAPKAASFRQRLSDLALASADHHEACEQYTRELERASGFGTERWKPSDAPFKSRAIALAVLKKLEEHPLAPEESRDAYRLIASAKPKDLEYPEFRDSVSVIEGFCGLVLSYVNWNRLVVGAERYKLTSTERERVRQVGRRWVTEETSYPGPLVGTKVAVSVFENLNDAYAFANREKLKPEILDLNDESERVREELSARYKPEYSNTIQKEAASRSAELTESYRIREKLRDLYEASEAAPTSATGPHRLR